MKNASYIKCFRLLMVILIYPTVAFTGEGQHAKDIILALKDFSKSLETDIGQVDKLKTKCYYGSTLLPTDNGVRYELFPELGFFRVQLTSIQSDNKWLYIKINKDMLGDFVKINNNNLEVSDLIKMQILAVGSGLMNQDLTKSNLTCWNDKNYYVYKKNINTKTEGSIEIKYLVLNKENPELTAYSIYNFWHDLPHN